MAYKVIILYQLYMPSYFLGTFTEYPYLFVGGVRVRRPVASVGHLAFSFTDRRNSSLRKKLYVTFPSDTTGRSEKARRHSPELQWSPNTNTADSRYHCMES